MLNVVCANAQILFFDAAFRKEILVYHLEKVFKTVFSPIHREYFLLFSLLGRQTTVYSGNVHHFESHYLGFGFLDKSFVFPYSLTDLHVLSNLLGDFVLSNEQMVSSAFAIAIQNLVFLDQPVH